MLARRSCRLGTISILLAFVASFGEGAKASSSDDVYRPYQSCTSTTDQQNFGWSLKSNIFLLEGLENSGEWIPRGTATIVDKRGYVIAAAHSTYTWSDEKLRLVQYGSAEPDTVLYEYGVRKLTQDHDHQVTDLVILQIVSSNYDPELYVDVGMRLGSQVAQTGWFAGFGRESNLPTIAEFYSSQLDGVSIEKGDSRYQFVGPVFPFDSGSLMFDGMGRAFALVKNVERLENADVDFESGREMMKIVYGGQQFGGFLFDWADDKLASIPPHRQVEDLINSIESGSYTEDDFKKVANLGSVVSPVDVTHLMLSFERTRWRIFSSTNYESFVNLVVYVVNQATANCMAHGLVEVLTAFREASSLDLDVDEAKFERVGDTESPIDPKILANFGLLARRIVLAEALNSEDTDSLSRFALASVKYAVNDNPSIDFESAEYQARLFTEWALLEDDAIPFGYGSEANRNSALEMATALGGTTQSFDLMARIEQEQGNNGWATWWNAKAIANFPPTVGSYSVDAYYNQLTENYKDNYVWATDAVEVPNVNDFFLSSEYFEQSVLMEESYTFDVNEIYP